jgi:hypothetical protein
VPRTSDPKRRSTYDRPAPLLEAKNLEGLREWVDQPRVAHAHTGVDGELLHAIERRCRGRHDLADPVGRNDEVGFVRDRGQALAARAPDIGDEDVGSKVELRLEEDAPSAGAASSPIERPAENGCEARAGVGMRGAGRGVVTSSPSTISATR